MTLVDYDSRLKRLSDVPDTIIINNYKCGFSSSNLLKYRKVETIYLTDRIVFFYRNVYLRTISVFVNWCITDYRYRTQEGWLFTNLKNALDPLSYRTFMNALHEKNYAEAFKYYINSLKLIAPLNGHTLPQIRILEEYQIDKINNFVELENSYLFKDITGISFPFNEDNKSDRTVKHTLVMAISCNKRFQRIIEEIYQCDLDYFEKMGLNCIDWKQYRGVSMTARQYKMYFPLFDHIEARSNEVRLTHAGLLAHPQVRLVDDPANSDFLIFCQNHLGDQCPLHMRFRQLKDRYKYKTIFLDYDDNPNGVYDADDFHWRLYFKRSCVRRDQMLVVKYGGLDVIPTAYCVVDEMVDPVPSFDGSRAIDISCLFDDQVENRWVYEKGRLRLLSFAKELRAKYGYSMQIGTVSETGSIGRSAINERYKQCLYSSKVILHANPDPWEGDSRTWEALSSGALVFLDRMVQPIEHPLVDGEHAVFYDLSHEGLLTLEEKIAFYLDHDEERERIGRQGREHVLAHHRPINRTNVIIERLEVQEADIREAFMTRTGLPEPALVEALDSTFQLSPRVSIQTNGGGVVLVKSDNGQFYNCNETGAAFIERLKERRTLGEILEQMASEFAVDWQTLVVEVAVLAVNLEQIDVLSRSRTMVRYPT